MYYPTLVLYLGFWALTKCAAASGWCYEGCAHIPSQWVELPNRFCGGSKQSPVDIVTKNVTTDPNLGNFNLIGFNSRDVFTSIMNNGHTVECTLKGNEVKVSGGGLSGTYTALQFHFHWGDVKNPGSEHTIDEHRYPMEMHIVTQKDGLTAPPEHPDGYAVLGFFINATDAVDMSEPWVNFTSYLSNLTNKGSKVGLDHSICIDDLIGNVNLTKFYRYMGSLTTPACTEAVVWTIFHEPIHVNSELIKKFPMETKLVNIYRPTQPLHKRHVYASPGTPLPPYEWCYDPHHCADTPPSWHLLPGSHCGGTYQSPININTNNVVPDSNLDAFIFKNFDDKHAIKYITNTGHSVKCVLVKNLMEVSGGGLEHDYTILQFHFHWGDTSDTSEGSEHTVNSIRYPMEMHIVSKRKDLTLDQALQAPDGLAVLGFFIESTHTTKRTSHGSTVSGTATTHPTSALTSKTNAWKKLTSYLSKIHKVGTTVKVTDDISIDDLLGDVNRHEYYRYSGSLTTPLCSETVVWTIFKESINVDLNLMKMFPNQTGYFNVYRPTQPRHTRTILTTAGSVRGNSGSVASASRHLLWFLLLERSICVYFI
ncbi:carbonic anhydrase-like [Oreochromis aureus]|uniref:carbonic anhydrase-like n=1 Tax=Oreochromis aureus TaxID=47969 RepID=UPI001954764F|nr:carbonic anhydrase-like [Oreochromis aureus]